MKKIVIRSFRWHSYWIQETTNWRNIAISPISLGFGEQTAESAEKVLISTARIEKLKY
jgi:hypothetical protein